MKKQVCILDYGSGNVQSVLTMVRMVCPQVMVSNRVEDIDNASHLILPGVGAFGASMEKIHRLLPVEILEEQVLQQKKPFLGICVGMQVLADDGYEFGSHKGLGWIPGQVKKLADAPRLPHIGWNSVEFSGGEPLAYGLGSETDFYFVHSFVFEPEDPDCTIATTEYGARFCSGIRHQNVVGVQFHPEKSQHFGKSLLANFLNQDECNVEEANHSRAAAKERISCPE